MIFLGAASDCVGTINGICTISKALKVTLLVLLVWPTAITPDEHDYGLESAGGLILLGRTCPTLPCTENVCDILDAVGFRTSRESIARSMTVLQPASLAFRSPKNDDEEIYGRILIEGCTVYEPWFSTVTKDTLQGPKDAR